MNAIQAMRQRAQAAGNLQTTPQQTVETQGSTIAIQPASPDVVYVPAYDPWVVYGDSDRGMAGLVPISRNLVWRSLSLLRSRLRHRLLCGVWMGLGSLGIRLASPLPYYNHARYYSQSNTFYNRNYYYRGGGERGVATNVERGVSANRGWLRRTPWRRLQQPWRNDAPFQRKRTGRSRICDPMARAHRAARAASAPARSATTIMAVRQEAFRHAEAPASAAEAMAAVSAHGGGGAHGGGSRGKRSLMMSMACRKPRKWRDAICGEQS